MPMRYVVADISAVGAVSEWPSGITVNGTPAIALAQVSGLASGSTEYG